MAFLEIDDAFLEKTLVFLNTSQVPIPVRCVPVAPGGGPGGPNTSIQYNDAGAFGGSVEWTHQRASAGVGPKATLQATADTDAATEFRCLNSLGGYGAVLSFSDDPIPANRFSTCAGDGLFQVDAFAGNLELKSFADVFVLPQGSFFAAGPGAGAANQSTGFEFWRHTGNGAGSQFNVSAVEDYQFVGTGAGASVSWTGIESYSTTGIGAPGSLYEVTGFDTYNAIGLGATSQFIVAQYQSAQFIGIGAGSTFTGSGWGQYNLNGIGPTSLFQIASIGTMNVSGAGPLASYNASGWDTLDELGTGSVTSLRRTRTYRAIERLLSIPIAGSYTRDRGFERQEFDGTSIVGGLWRVYQFENVSLESTAGGQVEINGAASASPQVRCNAATEASKAPDRVLAWNGTENEYRDAVRVLRVATSGSGGAPPSVNVNLSAAGVPDRPLKIVATLALQDAGAVSWMFRSETFAFVSTGAGAWNLVSNQGGVNSANPGGGIGLAAAPLGGGVIQFFALAVDPLMPLVSGDLILEIV